MAQPPEPNPLHNARGLTWSPLPTLCYKEGFSTESESTSHFEMAKEQLLDWEDFEANARANSDASLGEQTQFVPTQTERENVLVGNEHGLMGWFGQNVGHVMGEVNQACSLPIRYADYQAGKKSTEGQRRAADANPPAQRRSTTTHTISGSAEYVTSGVSGTPHDPISSSRSTATPASAARAMQSPVPATPLSPVSTTTYASASLSITASIAVSASTLPTITAGERRTLFCFDLRCSRWHRDRYSGNCPWTRSCRVNLNPINTNDDDGHENGSDSGEDEATDDDVKVNNGAQNVSNSDEKIADKPEDADGHDEQSSQIRTADANISPQVVGANDKQQCIKSDGSEALNANANDNGGSPAREKLSHIRTVVNRWNDEKDNWEEIEEDFEKAKDMPDKAATFRRHMDADNPKKIAFEEVEIYSQALKSLIAEADEWLRDSLMESNQPVTTAEPFQHYVWSWDGYEKVCVPQDNDPPATIKTREALEELLSKIKKSRALEPYFRSRDQIRSSRKIKFVFLWTLFGHGAKVYARSYMKELQMFEVKSCSDPPYNGKRLRVSCSAFDWDESKFSTYSYDFYIKEFSGKYDDSQLREQLVERGRKYCDLCSREPTFRCEYQGIAIVTLSGLHRMTLKGRAEDRLSSYSDPRWQFHDGQDLDVTSIDIKGKQSRVIIDNYAFLTSERNTMKRGDKPPLGKKIPYVEPECVCGICKSSHLQWRPESGLDRSLHGLCKAFSEDDDRLLFLPPRLLGFSLKDKLWGQFLVENLDHISPSENQEHTDPFWDELQLEPESKDLLMAYVKGHKALNPPKSRQDTNGIDAKAFDIIEGKVQGRVILLHGPPGVGKTLTAETIALATNKPLLTVSVAEMGIKAHEAEQKLTDVFSDASRWEAVLLMDEADIFVEERLKGDLERNALVSVLLHCLEYYDGIIILTTNRVRSIDSAVQSRIHLAIQYQDLNSQQRLAIFKNRLKWVPDEEIEDRKTLEKGLVTSPLGKKSNKANGRQIRNIVTGARDLAKSKKEKLTLNHLMTVYETTVGFIDGMADLVQK